MPHKSSNQDQPIEPESRTIATHLLTSQKLPRDLKRKIRQSPSHG